jgi:hypothetical protein
LIFEEPTEQGIGFRVCSRETSAEAGHLWRTHVIGRAQIRITPPQPDTQTLKRHEVLTRCSEEIDAFSFYDSLTRLGIDFGDRFRGIVRIRRRDGEALAEIRLPDVDERHGAISNSSRPSGLVSSRAGCSVARR